MSHGLRAACESGRWARGCRAVAARHRARGWGLGVGLLVAGFMAGCGEQTHPPTGEGPPPEVARQRLVELLTGPEEHFGDTPEQVRARLGAPRAQRVVERPHPDDPAQSDLRHELAWPGLELVFVESPGAEEAWLDRVRVDEAGHAWPPGDLLGMEPSQVVDWLGPPAEREAANHWIYADEMVAAYVHVTLEFEGGRVASVLWEAEAD